MATFIFTILALIAGILALSCAVNECFEDGLETPPKEVFAELWNSINGPDAWAANPWVTAISFTVERRNIDA